MNVDLNMQGYDYSVLFTHVFGPVLFRAGRIALWLLVVLLAIMVYAFMKYRLNPFHISLQTLRSSRIRFKPFNFIRWLILDISRYKEVGAEFQEYGFTVYCGRQGAGKTISMVNYLNQMHKSFPDALIVTNFQYKFATHQMKSWQDFFEIRNGTKGVIFAIDEIHSEYSNASWKDFPEALLSEISQQRKQRVKIVATSQVYSRIAKQIREQCYSVVQCKTAANRWTFTREYDAVDYELYSASTQKGEKLKSFRRISFVQSDLLRACFDTYEKIERLEKMKFIPRSER